MNPFNFITFFYDPFMKFFGLFKPDTIIKHLNPDGSESVLDVAGGTGFLSNKVRSHVRKVVVLDASRQMLKKAEKYDGLEICHAFSEDIPFDDETFDAVMCCDTLHHLTMVDETLSEIKRVLKTNGKLIIVDLKPTGLKGLPMWIIEKVFFRSSFIKPDSLLLKLEKLNIHGKIFQTGAIEFLFSGRKK